jgi:two-component system sensor histidine kinase KdpD
MPTEVRRRTPEELLRQAQAEERFAVKGYLKIFLGYASGVGKSVRMFEEARRRRQRGQDIVVGAVQLSVSPQLQALLRELEVIPMKNGIEMELDTMIRRHPTVCVVDGLAYNNPPGARNAARWLDVRELLNAGIKVITSINIQYIAELQAQVEAITGKHVTDLVPVEFIKSADEIEIVDAPPEAPMERSPEQLADAARRQQRLSRLRELALVLAADVVDYQLEDYLERHGIQQRLGTQERILVCITPRANARAMIEAGRNIAERFHGELIVAYVSQPEISPADQAALDEKLEMARAAGASIQVLDGEDPADTILDFARARGITQLFIGHSQRSGLWAKIWGNPVEKLIRKSEGMDLRVFPQ